MKAFITGATGFIGNRLAMKLADENHEVIVLLRDKSQAGQFIKKGIGIVEGDIFSHEALINGCKSCDTVFHLAAYTKPVSEDSSLPYRTNVVGTLNVLEAARESSVKKLVVVSTAGTLGYSLDSHPRDERSVRPASYGTDYERTKAEAEKAVLENATSCPEVIIVNPTRVYGPGKDSFSNSVTRIISLYGKGLWRILPGDGKAIGNYVFVEDVVDGIILASEKGIGGEQYILGGENLSFGDLFGVLGEVYGKPRKLVKVGEPVLKLIVKIVAAYSWLLHKQPVISDVWIDKYLKNYILSSKKAEMQLGYKITPFREGAGKTIEWLKRRERNEWGSDILPSF
jgi:nucleoside-diphosphate-sugar epimerase